MAKTLTHCNGKRIQWKRMLHDTYTYCNMQLMWIYTMLARCFSLENKKIFKLSRNICNALTFFVCSNTKRTFEICCMRCSAQEFRKKKRKTVVFQFDRWFFIAANAIWSMLKELQWSRLNFFVFNTEC